MLEIMLCDFCLVSLLGCLPLKTSHHVVRKPKPYREAICGLTTSARSSANSQDHPLNMWINKPSEDSSLWVSLWSRDKSSILIETMRDNKLLLLLQASLFSEPEIEKHFTSPWEMCSDFQKLWVTSLSRVRTRKKKCSSWLLIS